MISYYQKFQKGLISKTPFYSTRVPLISDRLCQLRKFYSTKVSLISDRLCQLRKS
ncbi:hypothetical protein [Nostoc sp. ATCC 53789]|uniref:hypothetical protein n=1 Tax=Nostoc sp. ATCC 53789 TaxID=76335 RepID=UPI001C691FDC|nr:hypothetical protein [Nostoc sp. ATCC 53789]